MLTSLILSGILGGESKVLETSKVWHREAKPNYVEVSEVSDDKKIRRLFSLEKLLYLIFKKEGNNWVYLLKYHLEGYHHFYFLLI